MARLSRVKLPRIYSVTQTAELLNVDRRTVYKWLSTDEPEYAVIPREGWFRLPGSGYIRIKEWVVNKLQAGEL